MALPSMSAEHAIPGLPALSETVWGHGYDLARQFNPDARLGKVVGRDAAAAVEIAGADRSGVCDTPSTEL